MSGALACAAAALMIWPPRPRRLVPPGSPALAGLRRALRPTPLLAGAGAALVGALTSTPLVAALAAGAAAFGARAWQRRRSADRDEARLQALTGALAVLAAELRSGRSVGAATTTATAECPDPDITRALARALAEPTDAHAGSLPGPVADAVRWVAAAAQLSVRTGCSLEATLAAVEADLRARQRQLLELRSATAAPRASAVLLAALPVLGLVMGAGVGADPWRVLTTTAAGQVLLVAGVALEVAGVAWVARLIRGAVP